MATHVPGSASICIHSVCVAKNHRRKQIALNLLKEYISRLETARTAGKPYERVLLITHEPLRQLYERAGFAWAGKSNVVHGPEPWYEMRKDLGSGTQTAVEPEAQQMPAGLWGALQQSSTRTRPSTRPFTDFQGNINDVIRPDSDDDTISVNKFDLLCPRSGCGSIILKAGVGKWVERGSVQVRAFAHSFAVSSYPAGYVDGTSRASSTPQFACSACSPSDDSLVAHRTITDGVREHRVFSARPATIPLL